MEFKSASQLRNNTNIFSRDNVDFQSIYDYFAVKKINSLLSSLFDTKITDSQMKRKT